MLKDKVLVAEQRTRNWASGVDVKWPDHRNEEEIVTAEIKRANIRVMSSDFIMVSHFVKKGRKTQ